MTALADKMDNVENATVTVKEWEGDVIFLHEVKKGPRIVRMVFRLPNWLDYPALWLNARALFWMH